MNKTIFAALIAALVIVCLATTVNAAEPTSYSEITLDEFKANQYLNVNPALASTSAFSILRINFDGDNIAKSGYSLVFWKDEQKVLEFPIEAKNQRGNEIFVSAADLVGKYSFEPAERYYLMQLYQDGKPIANGEQDVFITKRACDTVTCVSSLTPECTQFCISKDNSIKGGCTVSRQDARCLPRIWPDQAATKSIAARTNDALSQFQAEIDAIPDPAKRLEMSGAVGEAAFKEMAITQLEDEYQIIDQLIKHWESRKSFTFDWLIATQIDIWRGKWSSPQALKYQRQAIATIIRTLRAGSSSNPGMTVGQVIEACRPEKIKAAWAKMQAARKATEKKMFKEGDSLRYEYGFACDSHYWTYGLDNAEQANDAAPAACLSDKSACATNYGSLLEKMMSELYYSNPVWQALVQMNAKNDYGVVTEAREIIKYANNKFETKEYADAWNGYTTTGAFFAGYPPANILTNYSKKQAEKINALFMPTYYKNGIYQCLMGLTDVRFIPVMFVGGPSGKAIGAMFALVGTVGVYDQAENLFQQGGKATFNDYLNLACNTFVLAAGMKMFFKSQPPKAWIKKAEAAEGKGIVIEEGAAAKVVGEAKAAEPAPGKKPGLEVPEAVKEPNTAPTLPEAEGAKARTALEDARRGGLEQHGAGEVPREVVAHDSAVEQARATARKAREAPGVKQDLLDATSTRLEKKLAKIEKAKGAANRARLQEELARTEVTQAEISAAPGKSVEAARAIKLVRLRAQEYLRGYQKGRMLTPAEHGQIEGAYTRTFEGLVKEHAVDPATGKVNMQKLEAIDSLAHKTAAVLGYQDHIVAGQPHTKHSVVHILEDLNKLETAVTAYESAYGAGTLLTDSQKTAARLVAMLHDLGYTSPEITKGVIPKEAKSHPGVSAEIASRHIEADLRAITGKESAAIMQEGGMTGDIAAVMGDDVAQQIIVAIREHGNTNFHYSPADLSLPEKRVASIFAMMDDFAADKIPAVIEDNPRLVSLMLKMRAEFASRPELATAKKELNQVMDAYSAAKKKGNAAEMAAAEAKAQELTGVGTALGEFRGKWRKQMLEVVESNSEVVPQRRAQYVDAVMQLTEDNFQFAVSPAVLRDTTIVLTKNSAGQVVAHATVRVSADAYAAIGKAGGEPMATAQVTKIAKDYGIRSGLSEAQAEKIAADVGVALKQRASTPELTNIDVNGNSLTIEWVADSSPTVQTVIAGIR